jgi:hypothetical protein
MHLEIVSTYNIAGVRLMSFKRICTIEDARATPGELFVTSGVTDEHMGNAPRRTLNLRGHERPIDTFVLTA